MEKRIQASALILFVLFALIAFNLMKFALFESKNLIANSYNRRLHVLNPSIQRGSIYDRDMNLLASSEMTDEGYTRKYLYPEEFSHTIGYMDYGKAGVEAKYNFDLQRLDLEMLQRLYNRLFQTPLKADSAVLTVDLELQRLAASQLGERRGAVVVLEPSTGKILSMASYPNYNPETLDENWDEIRNDAENSPLLNRAAQGLYPPGSTFKIVTTLSALQNQLDAFEFDCAGEETFSSQTIQCFNKNVHGHVNLSDALAYSCNTAFATLGTKLGSPNIKAAAENMLFNQTLSYPLEYSVPSFTLNKDSEEAELLQTSIGQGKTLSTPLHMAMLASAIANNGMIMKPYIVDHYINFNGDIKNRAVPQLLTQAADAEYAHMITEMMAEVVEKGTGTGVKIENIRVAAKTGTAENSSGDDHGWLLAFAPADNPKVCVAVLLENSGGSTPCQPIARAIIEKALEE